MNTLKLGQDDGIIKPKGCPFCGDKPSSLEIRETDYGIVFIREHIIRCESCDIEMSSYSEANAITLWNRRHEETPSEFERLIGKENSNV